MIAAGLQLMVLGMTIVFVFLILLVFLMTVTAWLVRRFLPEASATTAAASGTARGAGTAAATAPFDTHIPAIIAAITAHRKRIGLGDGADSDTHKGVQS